MLVTGRQNKKNLRDPTCDVACISSIIQDAWRTVHCFSENISRTNQDMKNL